MRIYFMHRIYQKLLAIIFILILNGVKPIHNYNFNLAGEFWPLSIFESSSSNKQPLENPKTTNDKMPLFDKDLPINDDVNIKKKLNNQHDMTMEAILVQCPQKPSGNNKEDEDVEEEVISSKNNKKCIEKILVNIRMKSKSSQNTDPIEKYLLLDEIYDPLRKCKAKLMTPYLLEMTRGEPVLMYPLEFTESVQEKNFEIPNRNKENNNHQEFNYKKNAQADDVQKQQQTIPSTPPMQYPQKQKENTENILLEKQNQQKHEKQQEDQHQQQQEQQQHHHQENVHHHNHFHHPAEQLQQLEQTHLKSDQIYNAKNEPLPTLSSTTINKNIDGNDPAQNKQITKTIENEKSEATILSPSNNGTNKTKRKLTTNNNQIPYSKYYNDNNKMTVNNRKLVATSSGDVSGGGGVGGDGGGSVNVGGLGSLSYENTFVESLPKYELMVNTNNNNNNNDNVDNDDDDEMNIPTQRPPSKPLQSLFPSPLPHSKQLSPTILTTNTHQPSFGDDLQHNLHASIQKNMKKMCKCCDCDNCANINESDRCGCCYHLNLCKCHHTNIRSTHLNVTNNKNHHSYYKKDKHGKNRCCDCEKSFFEKSTSIYQKHSADKEFQQTTATTHQPYPENYHPHHLHQQHHLHHHHNSDGVHQNQHIHRLHHQNQQEQEQHKLLSSNHRTVKFQQNQHQQQHQPARRTNSKIKYDNIFDDSDYYLKLNNEFSPSTNELKANLTNNINNNTMNLQHLARLIGENKFELDFQTRHFNEKATKSVSELENQKQLPTITKQQKRRRQHHQQQVIKQQHQQQQPNLHSEKNIIISPKIEERRNENRQILKDDWPETVFNVKLPNAWPNIYENNTVEKIIKTHKYLLNNDDNSDSDNVGDDGDILDFDDSNNDDYDYDDEPNENDYENIDADYTDDDNGRPGESNFKITAPLMSHINQPNLIKFYPEVKNDENYRDTLKRSNEKVPSQQNNLKSSSAIYSTTAASTASSISQDSGDKNASDGVNVLPSAGATIFQGRHNGKSSSIKQHLLAKRRTNFNKYDFLYNDNDDDDNDIAVGNGGVGDRVSNDGVGINDIVDGINGDDGGDGVSGVVGAGIGDYRNIASFEMNGGGGGVGVDENVDLENYYPNDNNENLMDNSIQSNALHLNGLTDDGYNENENDDMKYHEKFGTGMFDRKKSHDNEKSVENIWYSVYNITAPLPYLTVDIRIFQKHSHYWAKIVPTIKVSNLLNPCVNNNSNSAKTNNNTIISFCLFHSNYINQPPHQFQSDKKKINFSPDFRNYRLLIPENIKSIVNSTCPTNKTNNNNGNDSQSNYSTSPMDYEIIKNSTNCNEKRNKIISEMVYYEKKINRNYEKSLKMRYLRDLVENNEKNNNNNNNNFSTTNISIVSHCSDHLCLNILSDLVPAYSISFSIPFNENHLIYDEQMVGEISEIISLTSETSLNTSIFIKLKNIGTQQHKYVISIKNCPIDQSHKTRTNQIHEIPPNKSITAQFKFLLISTLPSDESEICQVYVTDFQHSEHLIAKRIFLVRRKSRCSCLWKCICQCAYTSYLPTIVTATKREMCNIMPKSDAQEAGFQVSLSKDNNHQEEFNWQILFLVLLGFFIWLLCLGFLKAVIGSCFTKIGIWKYDYLQPMQPYAKSSIWKRFFINTIFFLVFPCVVLCKCFIPTSTQPSSSSPTTAFIQTKTGNYGDDGGVGGGEDLRPQLIIEKAPWTRSIVQMECFDNNNDVDDDDNYDNDCCILNKVGDGGRGGGRSGVGGDDDDYDDDGETKRLINKNKNNCYSNEKANYFDSYNADEEDRDTTFVLTALSESRASLKMLDGHCSDDISSVRSSSKLLSSTNDPDQQQNLEAKSYVRNLVEAKIVYRTLSQPIGNIDISPNQLYSVRGYFMPTHGPGYEFITHIPLRQHWLIKEENQTINLERITPPSMLLAKEFTRKYKNKKDVLIANDLTTLPSVNAPCVTVSIQNSHLYSPDDDDEDGDGNGEGNAQNNIEDIGDENENDDGEDDFAYAEDGKPSVRPRQENNTKTTL